MAIEDDLNTNLLRTESSKTRVRKLQDIGGGYVPNFQGYLHLDFSVHVPCSVHNMEGCQLNIDDSSRAELESLVMLFLCSQAVDLVISTAPDELLHVCPFASDKPNSNNRNSMVVWNLPRFDAKMVAFEDPNEPMSIQDKATNTTIFLSVPKRQYYTRLHFTYPVYQWGALTSEKADSLQEQFETSLIETGTLDSLLPWEGAIVAATGQEPYVFWNAPTPAPKFDTTISQKAGLVLQRMGISIMVLNTLLLLVLTIMLQIRKRRPRKKPMTNWKTLDTEEGISAILRESKNYALSKSFQQRANLNVSGVEEDLKLVEDPDESHMVLQAPPSPMLHRTTPPIPHRSKSPMRAKEDFSLAQAKIVQGTNGTVTLKKKTTSPMQTKEDYLSAKAKLKPVKSPMQTKEDYLSARAKLKPVKSPMQTKEDYLLARAKMIQGTTSTPHFTDTNDKLLQQQESYDDEDLGLSDLVDYHNDDSLYSL